MIQYDGESILIKVHPISLVARLILTIVSVPMFLGGLLALYNVTRTDFIALPIENLTFGIAVTVLLFIISLAGLHSAFSGQETLRFDHQTQKVFFMKKILLLKFIKVYDFSDVPPPSLFFHKALHDEDSSKWGLKFEMPDNNKLQYYPVVDYPDLAIFFPSEASGDFESIERESLLPQKVFAEEWRNKILKLLVEAK